MKRVLAGLTLLSLIAGVSLPVGAVANPQRVNEIKESARLKAEERKSTKEEKIKAIKEDVAERKLALKQEKCEARKSKLQEKIPQLSNSATVIKGVIDNKYAQVQDFYSSGQLTVSDYEAQVEEIELAKANAETALLAISEYEFEVDCTNLKIGEQLDGFRTAVKEARVSLKEYRKELVGLISSLKAEAAEHSHEDEAEHEEETTEPIEQEETSEPVTEVENEQAQ